MDGTHTTDDAEQHAEATQAETEAADAYTNPPAPGMPGGDPVAPVTEDSER